MVGNKSKLLAGIALSLLAFSACSSEASEPVSRGAAADEPPVPEVQSGDLLQETMVGSSNSSPSTDVNGVRFCVTNQSSTVPTVTLEPVSGGASESRGLGRGDEVCVRGQALVGRDIRGGIAVDGLGQVMEIGASRPALWLSWVELVQPKFGQCLYSSYFQNSSGSTVDDGVLQYKITRGKDTDATNFKITLSDPRQKSSNGEPVKGVGCTR